MTATLLIATTALVTAGLAASPASLALTTADPTNQVIIAPTADGRHGAPEATPRPATIVDYAHLSEWALEQLIEEDSVSLREISFGRLASHSPPAGRPLYRF